MEPAAAALMQTVQQQVNRVCRVSKMLVAWPWRLLYGPGMTFGQVYWYHQVISNLFEVMFGLLFFLTLQRKVFSSGSSIFTSLGQLQDDVRKLFDAQEKSESEISYLLGAAYQLLEKTPLGGLLWPVLFPIRLCWVLLDFNADFVIVTMLLPHVFLLWSSVTSLLRAVQKAVMLLLKAGKAVHSGVRKGADATAQQKKKE
eukprot:TRINITY_DN28300_c0_g1_i1.p1 TRINITY_DN28300_c0_g1~~TRINITY_DN28300_c0_g1_i1.p1  ORF type:complete len:200 (+),score=54.48 TRINITY_DN28300_c0_g1_i1:273-872(+)